MSGDTALILTAADTFHHICYITGQHFFGSDDSGLLSCGMVCCRSPVNILPYLPRGSLYDGEFSPGCIMSVLHSGGLGCLSAVCPQDRGVRIHCSQHWAQFLLGNVSGPQDLWRCHRQVNNGGFQANPHLTAINDGIDPPHHIFFDIFCHCGTGLAGSIGTGRRNISPAVFDQLLRRRMRGHTDCYRIQTTCGLIRHRV